MTSLILAVSVTEAGAKPAKALFPKIRSRKGVNMPSENKLKRMDNKINRPYQPI
jgi:hypothetical protein